MTDLQNKGITKLQTGQKHKNHDSNKDYNFSSFKRKLLLYVINNHNKVLLLF